MKKIKLFLIIFLLLFGIKGYNQNSKIDFGIVAGPAYTYLTAPENKSLNKYPRVAFSSGIFIELKLSDKINYSSELLFERKSTLTKLLGQMWIDEGNRPSDVYSKQHFDYLTVPVSLKYELLEKQKIYFKAGAYIGYLLSSHGVIANSQHNAGEHYNRTSNYNKLDFGFLFSMGKQLMINDKKYLLFEFRYNLGMINIHQRTDQSVKTNSFVFLIGMGNLF